MTTQAKPFATIYDRLRRSDDEDGRAPVVKTPVSEPGKHVGPNRPLGFGFPMMGVATGALPIAHRTL